MSLIDSEWKWDWRKDGDETNCGIYAEPDTHAYAICRCPRYLTKDQWEAIAKHVCDLHNAQLSR